MYRARRPGSTADRDAHPFTPTAEFNVHIGSRAHRHRRRRSTLGLTRLASWAGFGGISSRQSRTGVTRTQCRHLLSLVGSDTKTAVHPQILGRYSYCLTWLNEYFRCRPRPPLGVPPSSLDGGRTAGLPVALLLPPSPTASARREGPAPDLEGHVLLHQQPGIRPSDHDSPRLLAPRPIPCQSWWASEVYSPQPPTNLRRHQSFADLAGVQDRGCDRVRWHGSPQAAQGQRPTSSHAGVLDLWREIAHRQPGPGPHRALLRTGSDRAAAVTAQRQGRRHEPRHDRAAAALSG